MAMVPFDAARCATLMRRALTTMAVGAFLAGCPGALDKPERFSMNMDSGTCSDVETTIFIPTCGGVGCHENPGAAGNLDLVTPGVAARIKAATSTCMAKPMTSYLLEKLKPSPGCGSRMPIGASDPFPADQYLCLEQYLAKLADGGI
jgi:hypothetical protein